MRYTKVKEGIFLSRPNRFIAYVMIDGREEICHVKNTGRCRELLIYGTRVFVEESDNPNRKTLYDLVAVEKRYDEISDWKNYPLAFQQRMKNGKEKSLLFNIDSQSPNKVVLEWLQKQRYDKIKPEYTFGKSRVDFYIEKIDEATGKTEKILMEVKGCTLEIEGVGYFPDAPTERGVKHLTELAAAATEGYKAILAFVIQMEGVEKVLPNAKTHPEFAAAVEKAKNAGVEVWFLPCKV
jgi:sugar fermentation stimulation protein A